MYSHSILADPLLSNAADVPLGVQPTASSPLLGAGMAVGQFGVLRCVQYSIPKVYYVCPSQCHCVSNKLTGLFTGTGLARSGQRHLSASAPFRRRQAQTLESGPRPTTWRHEVRRAGTVAACRSAAVCLIVLSKTWYTVLLNDTVSNKLTGLYTGGGGDGKQPVSRDGLSYKTAWPSCSKLNATQWAAIQPGDTLYLCGLAARSLNMPSGASNSSL
jgi:hypothetical protein